MIALIENRRKKMIIILISIIICAGIFAVFQEFKALRHTETTILEGSNHIKTYTAKEAINSMSRYIIGQKLMEDPLLVSITSTDSTETDNIIYSGKDGKRSAWNGEFGDIKGSKVVVCALRGAEIRIDFISEAKNIPDNEYGQKHLAIGQYRVNDIKLDSNDQIVLDKIKELKLKPGNPSQDWIRGYHYSIYEPALNDSENDSLVLAVLGISPESPNEKGESMMAICEFNAKDGSFIRASKKIGYDRDGRSIWESM